MSAAEEGRWIPVAIAAGVGASLAALAAYYIHLKALEAALKEGKRRAKEVRCHDLPA